MTVRFAHINIVAIDWRRLASFYEAVFGCTPIYPERDLSGAWLDDSIGICNAHISGMHLQLPGCGTDGPTLEIFQYDDMVPRPETALNRLGLAHIAFAVDDVARKAKAVRDAGGRDVGKLTEVGVPGVGQITFQYVADPEGNIIELQKWT